MKLSICTFGVCLMAAGAASAQQQEPSSWGVSGALAPLWKVPADQKIFTALFDADQVNVNGSEFRVGFVRGRMLGGDWGVSFLRRRIDDGSTVSRGMDEFAGFTTGEFITTRNVVMNGVEVHKFAPFVTIKERVQVGLTFGGGIGQTTGVLDTRFVDADFTFVGNQNVIQRVETTEALDAKELIFPGNGLVPLGRLELAVAGVVGHGFKVRVSGGVAYPGTETFTISGVYLFGAK